MKKLIAIVLTLIFALSMVGCGGSKPVESSKPAPAPAASSQPAESKKEEPKKLTVVDKIKQAGKIVVLTSADFPPFESLDPKDGKTIIGFDVDLCEAVAKKLGVKLEMKDTKFDGLIPALLAGNADMIAAGMTPTAKRKESVDFSEVYYATDQVLVVRADDDSMKSSENMKGKKIGAQLGSTSEEAGKKIPGIQMKTLDKVDQLCLQVKNKNLDGLVVEQTVAEAYVKSMGGLKIVKDIKELKEVETGSAFAAKKGDAELVKICDEVIKELKSSGQYDKLVEKWFVTK